MSASKVASYMSRHIIGLSIGAWGLLILFRPSAMAISWRWWRVVSHQRYAEVKPAKMRMQSQGCVLGLSHSFMMLFSDTTRCFLGVVSGNKDASITWVEAIQNGHSPCFKAVVDRSMYTNIQLHCIRSSAESERIPSLKGNAYIEFRTVPRRQRPERRWKNP